jgi:hypothetical protein
MHGDLGQAAQGFRALDAAAKIERAPDPEVPHYFDIAVGEMAKMVGAEDLPPADPAAISCGITAEIAEIAGAGEIEMTGRDF